MNIKKTIPIDKPKQVIIPIRFDCELWLRVKRIALNREITAARWIRDLIYEALKKGIGK